MEQETLNYKLIIAMLKEFGVTLNSNWVHPDICEKGAMAIQTLLTQNRRMKTLLTGSCSACQHRGTYELGSPCDSCIQNSRVVGNGWGMKNNWEWKASLDIPCPVLSEPLTEEELQKMPEKPYWHVGLQADSKPPHWAILPEHVAKRPQDYFYGKYWLAYRCETANGNQSHEAAASMPAENHGPLSIEEMKALYDGNEGAVWVVFGKDSILPAILDVYEDELIAVWCGGNMDDVFWEKDYGTYWRAYRTKADAEQDNVKSACATTEKPCSHCRPGPCEHRREDA